MALLRCSWALGLSLCMGCTVAPGKNGAEAGSGTETGDDVDRASTCDPLRQDCPPEYACQLRGQVFDCVQVGPDAGGHGDACGPYAGPCAAGLECGAEIIVGCSDGFGCCTSYCDPVEDDCPGSLRCAALYSGDPPPNTPDVGICSPGG